MIENQLEQSDDSHCLRLLGYAAGAEAGILIWVARDFTPYHRSILEWLNAADTIHVYAVEVRAYRVGGVLAADFRAVVKPVATAAGAPLSAKNSNTLYAEFYRPLVARLRQGGLEPGGWRGKWRQFHTGHAGASYGLGLVDGKAQVFLSFKGPDRQERYRALLRHREEIDGRVEGAISWQEEGPGSWGESLVVLERARRGQLDVGGGGAGARPPVDGRQPALAAGGPAATSGPTGTDHGRQRSSGSGAEPGVCTVEPCGLL